MASELKRLSAYCPFSFHHLRAICHLVILPICEHERASCRPVFSSVFQRFIFFSVRSLTSFKKFTKGACVLVCFEATVNSLFFPLFLSQDIFSGINIIC